MDFYLKYLNFKYQIGSIWNNGTMPDDEKNRFSLKHVMIS